MRRAVLLVLVASVLVVAALGTAGLFVGKRAGPDRMAKRAREKASPLPAPTHVRYCIACGSPRIVALADATVRAGVRCEECATQFHAELLPLVGG